MKKILCIITAVFLILCVLSSCNQPADSSSTINGITGSEQNSVLTIENVPEFSNSPYIAVYNNQPEFETPQNISSFETYSPLDSLGRCGVAFACIGQDLMPTEDRGGIGQIKPSGWKTVKYDMVDGKYLYNRCHLIGFQLTGENANEKNLITGTRYMNVDGMLPFENMVADYIKETDNHVLYRVTPVYDGDALVARGVQMEALSLEDNGDGICFNVYVYNNQPGIIIDYQNGESRLADDQQNLSDSLTSDAVYILNIGSKKIHKHNCTYAKSISSENLSSSTNSVDELIKQGYDKCKLCFE